MAECHKKIAEIVTSGKWKSFENKPRGEFFAWLKTAFNNHIKSIVVRHRLTAKRGYDPYNKKKNVDVSIDDPEFSIQVSDRNVFGDDELVQSGEVQSWLVDIEPLLTPIEVLVLRQIVCPNRLSYLYARVTPGNSKRSIVISKINLAAGIGLDVDTYNSIEKSVRKKVDKYYMDPQEDDILFNSSVRALEKAFDLQIPPNIERVVIQRLITLAARDQYEIVDDNIRVHMRNIGARVPELQGNSNLLKCFGILYKADHRACISCSMHDQCRAQAQNIGLGSVTISPKLLGAKGQRISTVCITDSNAKVDVIEDTVDVQIVENQDGPEIDNDQRNEEIVTYLASKMKRVMNKSETLFRFNDKLSHGKVRYIFIIKDRASGGPFMLRFCKPTEAMKDKLTKNNAGYYLPATATADEACRLIEQHINESFV